MAYIPSNANGQATMANSGPVVIASNQSAIPVSGTFWQATQPVSLASVPTHGVTGTFWQATQPVSLVSVPTHAVTLASTTITGTVTVTGTVTTSANDTHDGVAGTTGQMGVAYASSTAPTAVSANGDAVRLWATTTGALNVADGGGSLTVDGTFWQTTQPVSLASVPTHGVTGTFWQATQPVSGTVAIGAGAAAIGTVEIGATSLAALETTSTAQSGTWTVGLSAAQTLATVTTVGTVSAITAGPAIGSAFYVRNTDGTNTAAVKAASVAAVATDPALVVAISPNNTVPVSLASVPTHGVTGTFWQTTQPVSLASVPTHGVTGTFWQTTQPVSIASMPSTPVTGTFWQATQPVSLVSVPTHAVTQSGTWTVTTAANDTHDDVAGTSGQMPVGYAYGIATADNTLPVVSANADAARFITNKNGAQVVVQLPEATQAYAPTNVTTTAYATSLIAKASAGTLYVLTGYNSKTAAQFIQIHDSATLPTDTAVPKVIFYVPASSNFSYDLGTYGRYFTAGITVCNSSTGPTKTIGSADCWFDVQVK